MYRLVNWAFDLFNEISSVIIQTPPQRSFGNSAEEIFYGLIRAKKEGKKVLFLDWQGELPADLFVLTHPVNDPFEAARIRARGARGMYTGYLSPPRLCRSCSEGERIPDTLGRIHGENPIFSILTRVHRRAREAHQGVSRCR